MRTKEFVKNIDKGGSIMSDLITFTNNEIVVKEEVLQKLKAYNEIKLKASLLEQEIKRDLQEAMEKYDVKKWDNEVFTATYIAPTTRNRFDSKRFREELPELYEEYQTTSNVKGSVRIKYKEE